MEIIVLVNPAAKEKTVKPLAGPPSPVDAMEARPNLSADDIRAVEQALDIRDERDGAVTAVCVGGPAAKRAILSALAMGANQGMWVRIDEPLDLLARARVLAAALSGLSFDLILKGQGPVDGDPGLVAAMAVEMLDLPQIQQVVDIEVGKDGVTCSRIMDNAAVRIQAPLPALASISQSRAPSRFVSMANILAAGGKGIKEVTPKDLGLTPETLAPLVQTLSREPLPAKQTGRIITGKSMDSVARELVRILAEDEKVI